MSVYTVLLVLLVGATGGTITQLFLEWVLRRVVS